MDENPTLFKLETSEISGSQLHAINTEPKKVVYLEDKIAFWLHFGLFQRFKGVKKSKIKDIDQTDLQLGIS